MMKAFAAVAWDIDGTLIDSEPLHHRALLAACLGFGLDLADLPDDVFRGVHVFDVWARLRPRLGAGVSSGEFAAAIDDDYVAHASEVAPMPGAVETISRLADIGVSQVCVSNSGRAIVDANLRALGVGGHILFSISLDDVAAGKPDPEPYRAAAVRLSLPPDRIIAVEDSVTGARSARAAGLFVVGYSAAEADFGDCDARVDRLSQVPALLGV